MMAFQNRALTQRSYIYYSVTKRTFKHIIQSSAQHSHQISALFRFRRIPLPEIPETTDKGKKRPFTSSGEQMTVTIPDSLSDVEIKENYVLAITFDENGNVTAVEVKSKGRNKSGSNQPSSGSKSEKGSNSGNNPITNADGTTQL